MANNEVFYDWSPEKMVEVILKEPDDFLKVRETLTRIGIASRPTDDPKEKRKLIQSCHILHKRGKYFCLNFKELFLLDGKDANLTESDVERRNTIACLLADWELWTIKNPDQIGSQAPLNEIKVIPFRDKENWDLQTKYSIGGKKRK